MRAHRDRRCRRQAAPVQALIVIGDYITFMYEKPIDAIIKRRKLPALIMGRGITGLSPF